MRNRWRRLTGRRMARPVTVGPTSLGPRTRIVVGWVAAAVLIAVIAFVVGRPGKDAGAPDPSPTRAAAAPLPIAFGTALDSATGVAIRPTDRFASGDLFAYSVQLAAPIGRDAVEVEVLRVGQPPSVVQEPAAQEVSSKSRLIAFSVPANALIKAFGEGEFVMRIYGDPSDKPLAEGHFRLIGAGT